MSLNPNTHFIQTRYPKMGDDHAAAGAKLVRRASGRLWGVITHAQEEIQMKLFVIAFLFLGALLMMAIGLNKMGNEEPPDPKRFYDDMNGYSILFPEGWKVEREYRGNTVTALCPVSRRNDKFYVSISVSVEELPYQSSLLEFFDATTKWTFKEYRRVKKLNEGKLLINEQEARWVTFEFDTEDGKVRTLAYCLVRGKQGYTISCNCEPYKYEAFRATLESAAKSFRFE